MWSVCNVMMRHLQHLLSEHIYRFCKFMKWIQPHQVAKIAGKKHVSWGIFLIKIHQNVIDLSHGNKKYSLTFFVYKTKNFHISKCFTLTPRASNSVNSSLRSKSSCILNIFYVRHFRLLKGPQKFGAQSSLRQQRNGKFAISRPVRQGLLRQVQQS